MALRATLTAPRAERDEWPWHVVTWASLPSNLLVNTSRRLEADAYLAGGYGVRVEIETRKAGWQRLETLAKVWQPNRLKGIQVGPEFGAPFLAATQVFDLRPRPRKWLSLDRTEDAADRFVKSATILVTCSGSVGRSTIAGAAIAETLISHDLLRVEPRNEKLRGWLYAFLRSSRAQAMMTAAQYGQIIKHLEVEHLNLLPVPVPRDTLLEHFHEDVERIRQMRDRELELKLTAERLLADAIGPVTADEKPELGFTRSARDLFSGRRRLEGAYHSPRAAAILRRFSTLKLPIQLLSEVTERVWWMTRFKRVFGADGVPYLSADELFSLNPAITKRVLIEQAENAGDYFVKAGWLVMACSGQVYGLNGSVALMTKRHEGSFFSHDLVRIVPKGVRPGYLVAALSHPTLGRPLVVRQAYGTSIPHLDPADVAAVPIVRLGDKAENEIADLMESASAMHTEADQIENSLAAEADDLILRLIHGNLSDFTVG